MWYQGFRHVIWCRAEEGGRFLRFRCGSYFVQPIATASFSIWVESSDSSVYRG